MKTIHKYKLTDTTTLVNMPSGSVVLDCQLQNGVATLWVLVHDDTAQLCCRAFTMISTGDLIDPTLQLTHISTIQDGTYVFHVFERI